MTKRLAVPYRYTPMILALAAASESYANDCQPGEFEAVLDAGCIPAQPGRYVPTAGATASTAAPAGSFVNTTGASAATLAPVGTFVATSGQSAATLASPGSFVSTTGATTATLASPGTFVSTSGATVATQASPGTFVANAGQAEATLAPLGFFVSASGATAATLAPVGSFVATSGQSAATQATPGSFVSTTGASAATLASAGSFVSTSGASAATLASPGTFVSISGAVQAGPCLGDSTSYGGSVACRAGVDLVANTVSPVFDSTYGLGGNFDLGILDVGTSTTFGFDVFNTSMDLGFADPLTDLTILDMTFTGLNADYFSLESFLPRLLLHEGNSQAINFLFNAPNPGSFDVFLTISTDQFAPLGGTGEEFSYQLTGSALVPVPAPASSILFMLGLLGIFGRHRLARK